MLRKLIDNLKQKRVHFIVEEQDVTKTLAVINKYHRCAPEVRIGNCGWAYVDDTSVYDNKWFIHFTTNISKWEKLIDELKVVRVFRETDIPKNTNGKVYSTD